MKSYTNEYIDEVLQKGIDALHKDDIPATLQCVLDGYGMLRHRELACKMGIFTCEKANRKDMIRMYFDAFEGRLILGTVGIPLFWLLDMANRKFSFAKPKE